MSTAWQRFQQEVSGRKVLVFGLGIQGGGVAAANTLVQAGAQVRATDIKTETELTTALTALNPQVVGRYGAHSLGDVEWAEIILKNPAVPFSHPLISLALAQGKKVITETTWALRYLRDQAIGITGTRGKTTTSHLIHALLQAAGRHPILCGNIPQKPTLSFLPEVSESTPVVIEISSFHLESCAHWQVSPHQAVITNVYPDHLNRYESLAEYAQTKALIFRYQQAGDHAYFGRHHDWADTLAEAIQPGVIQHILTRDTFQSTAAAYPSPLPGEHNRENLAFAIEVARTLGVDEATIHHTIAQFRGVPFRLEKVAIKHGVTFINDTTSTTPVALEKALDATVGPYVLIAGGATKHLPLPESLLQKIRRQPRQIIWLPGSGTNEILAQLGPIQPPISADLKPRSPLPTPPRSNTKPIPSYSPRVSPRLPSS